MWDFSKIPDDQWDNFKNLYDKRDFIAIVLFHNKYKLSEYEYCCNNNGIFKWAKYGLKWKENKEKV
jgi:beta-xylosidase